jgi:DNA-binding response OmpR family regulator
MSKNSKILYVDDEYINLNIMQNILSDYTLYLVTNKIDAYKILEENKIDLILLDVVMPDIMGTDLCKELKSDEEYKNIPVIFITATDTDETIIEAFTNGAIDFVKKPINIVDLQQRIKLNLKNNSTYEIDSNYTFNLQTLQLYKDNIPIKLTGSEQKLLELFIRKKDTLIDPIDISNHLFDDFDKEYNNRTIRNIISSLKKKLPQDVISSVYGQGYMFH